MNVQLLAHTPEPEKLITTAAKPCIIHIRY